MVVLHRLRETRGRLRDSGSSGSGATAGTHGRAAATPWKSTAAGSSKTACSYMVPLVFNG